MARFIRNLGSQFLFLGNRATRIGGSIPEERRCTIPVLGEVCHLYFSQQNRKRRNLKSARVLTKPSPVSTKMCGRTCCTLAPCVVPLACTAVTPRGVAPTWTTKNSSYRPSTNVPPTRVTPILVREHKGGPKYDVRLGGGEAVKNVSQITDTQ